MNTVRKPSRLPALGVFVLLLAILGAALLLGNASEERGRQPAPAVVQESPTPASASAAGLQRDGNGCLVPRFGTRNSAALRPQSDQWRLAASGDRLQEDPCGHIWALWFNSWTVFRHGAIEEYGYLALSPRGPIGALARSGVASFLSVPGGQLWLLGNRGELARYRHGAWEPLPARPNCAQGQLLLVDAEVWLACGAPDPMPLAAWNETALAWRAVPGFGHGSVERLAHGPDGRLYAAGGGRVLEYRGGTATNAWRSLAEGSETATAFAVDRERIYLGTSDGLHLFDARGKPLARVLGGKTITGIAANDRGGVWVSATGAGLHYFNGRRWFSWRYAQGLPDDESRDVLIDARGWLWLGGTPAAVIDERAAAARIVELQAAERLPGRQFADACLAAKDVLGDRRQSGQVAQAERDGKTLVFFAGTQVCPFPPHQALDAHLHFRRASDGALLEVPFNGSRGSSSCGSPCSDEQRARFAPLWTVRVHETDTRAMALPSPVPAHSPGESFLLTRRGDIWLATRDAGLYRHDGRRWQRYGMNDGFGPGNIVQAMVEDAEGFVWVASSPQYDRQQSRHVGAPLQRWYQGKWQRYTPDEGLAYWSAQALAKGPGGMAVGTNGGLSLVAASGIKTFGAKQLGTHTFVNGIAADDSGVWWLAHGIFNEGLSIGQGERFSHLTSREGLFDDQLQAIAHDDLGQVWLLAENGKVAVYERALLIQRAQVAAESE